MVIREEEEEKERAGFPSLPFPTLLYKASY